MTIDELKVKVEKERTNLEKKTGQIVQFSKNGPISIHLIDAIVQVIEEQQKTINELKSKLDNSNPK